MSETDIAPAAPTTARGTVLVEELSRARQAVARRVAESRATIPDLTVAATIAVDGLAEPAIAGGPSFAAAVVRAAALALRAHPRANGAYRDARLERYGRVNVGLVVATDDAPLIPTVFDADARTLAEVAAETGRLADRARSGEIAPPELSGGTFTVWVIPEPVAFTPVITPGQAAALAVGAPRPAPVVRDGAVAPGLVADAVLAADHRILLPDDAAALLATIAALLADPVALAG